MRQRIISAVIALLICIPIIIYGQMPFYIGAALIGLIGFIEMLSLKSKKRDIPYLMKILGVISFILIMLGDLNIFGSLNIIDYERITTILFLLLIPIVFYNKSKKYDINDALYLLGSVFFLGIGFRELISVRILGLNYLLFLISITIFTDTFAYLTGMLIGKHKLSPTVSPNKSLEGLIGGLLFSTFICSTIFITIFDYTDSILLFVMVVFILSLIGQIGDLVFSAIKRNYNIKDFGNIMPGHGGILDRLDSIIFVALAFSYVIRFI